MFCEDSVRWLYRLEENFSWESGLSISQDYAFKDKTGVVRLILESGGRITVTRDYAWNGCSPKSCFFDLLFGTPDGVVHAQTGKPKTHSRPSSTMPCTTLFPMGCRSSSMMRTGASCRSLLPRCLALRWFGVAGEEAYSKNCRCRDPALTRTCPSGLGTGLHGWRVNRSWFEVFPLSWRCAERGAS